MVAHGLNHRRLTTIYTQVIPPGKAVLEVGCAKGDLLAAVNPGYGVGIDFCSNMLYYAKNKYPHLHFLEANAHKP